MLLAVKKPAKIFDVAIVGYGGCVFTLNLAYIEDSYFFCIIVMAKNIAMLFSFSTLGISLICANPVGVQENVRSFYSC